MVYSKTGSASPIYNDKFEGTAYTSISSRPGNMNGAKRVIIFCCMTAILPTLFIITPLYLRHSVFSDVIYPVAESDILAIVDGISSIFCQAHTLEMNTSFNAFQLNGTPQLSDKKKHIRLKKSMILPDDTLEYWGFYLLHGAVVKLKVCSRYEGSRILVVKGEKNLNTCGLLKKDTKTLGRKMDSEHNKVKVIFENAAEVIGIVDDKTIKNVGAEEIDEAEVDQYVKNRLNKGRERQNSKSKYPKKVDNFTTQDTLEVTQNRTKRSNNALDAHIAHGGNAGNNGTHSDESSVSSFETELLACYDGQILLTQEFPPSHLCNDVHYLERSSTHMHTIHEVGTDGYYYYIFYSDNDFVKNDIHAVFDIYKPTYRFTTTNNKSCINQTECTFPISFLSDETVIVEVPTRDGIEHEADDITLLKSRCQPRMAIYMIFPILVLFLILVCAFL